MTGFRHSPAQLLSRPIATSADRLDSRHQSFHAGQPQLSSSIFFAPAARFSSSLRSRHSSLGFCQPCRFRRRELSSVTMPQLQQIFSRRPRRRSAVMTFSPPLILRPPCRPARRHRSRCPSAHTIAAMTRRCLLSSVSSEAPFQ